MWHYQNYGLADKVDYMVWDAYQSAAGAAVKNVSRIRAVMMPTVLDEVRQCKMQPSTLYRTY